MSGKSHRRKMAVAAGWLATALLFGQAVAMGPSPACAASAKAAVITFKVVKQSAGMASKTPELRLLSAADAWQVHLGPSWSGENPREVFFTVETDQAKAELPRVAVVAPGVVPARVIVGKQDVPFQHQGDTITFTLVRDTRNAMLLNQTFPDSEGGLPIGIYHNWLIRQDGPYRDKPPLEVEAKAVLNYLVAAREALKRMGGFGPKDRKAFEGEITLLGFEVACARGHRDDPPHVHIMMYGPGYVGGEVPHFYMDASGKIVRNRFDILGDEHNKFPERAKIIAEKRRRAGDYGPGQPCRLEDLQGRVGLTVTITPEGGLLLEGNRGQPYLLIGDAKGPDHAVLVKQGEKTLVRAHVVDDAERGETRVTVEHLGPGSGARVVHQSLRYDPYTGLAPRKGSP